jgi:hypothetical protein
VPPLPRLVPRWHLPSWGHALSARPPMRQGHNKSAFAAGAAVGAGAGALLMLGVVLCKGRSVRNRKSRV